MEKMQYVISCGHNSRQIKKREREVGVEETNKKKILPQIQCLYIIYTCISIIAQKMGVEVNTNTSVVVNKW